jgi:hypothetical protein
VNLLANGNRFIRTSVDDCRDGGIESGDNDLIFQSTAGPRRPIC